MGPPREMSAELVGDARVLEVTVALSLQDVSLHCPEPGASEEGLASGEAEPVSLGPAVGEDRGAGPQSPLQEGWTMWGTASVMAKQSRGQGPHLARVRAAWRRVLGGYLEPGKGVCGGGNGRRTARGRKHGVLENRVRL